jgi:hypothetical protein
LPLAYFFISPEISPNPPFLTSISHLHLSYIVPCSRPRTCTCTHTYYPYPL